MGAFAQFLEKHKIKPEQLARVSERLERGAEADAGLRVRRAQARADKKTYAELEIAKPASGRGVSLLQIGAAKADQPLARRVRGKLLRAARTLAKDDSLDSKALFGDVGRKAGLRRVVEALKKKAGKAGKS